MSQYLIFIFPHSFNKNEVILGITTCDAILTWCFYFHGNILYYFKFAVCCLFSVSAHGFRSLDHELLSPYKRVTVALGKGRTGFSELGRLVRERLGSASDQYKSPGV
jgi:hypothetical protein